MRAQPGREVEEVDGEPDDFAGILRDETERLRILTEQRNPKVFLGCHDGVGLTFIKRQLMDE